MNSNTNYQVITIYNVEAHSCFYKWQPWEEPGFVMCQLWNLYGGSGGRSFKHSQLSDTKCQSLLFQILEFPQWSFQKTPIFLLFDATIICSSITSFLTYSQNRVLTKPIWCNQCWKIKMIAEQCARKIASFFNRIISISLPENTLSPPDPKSFPEIWEVLH